MLKQLVKNTNWAITPDGLHGIVKAINRELTSEDYSTFHKAASDLYGKLDPHENVKIGNTGYIFIDGPIVPRDSMFTQASNLTSVQAMSISFAEFEEDGEIEQIAFIVDSPGGSVDGISEFAQAVKKSKKKTKAFVTGMAASAAYWIVSAVDDIYAVDTAEIGSIGVLMTLSSDTDDRVIIQSSQSPNKRPDVNSENGRAIYQKRVDDLAAVMIDFIAKNRDVDAKTVETRFGAGSVMIADKAKKAGMIDGVSTLQKFMTGTAQTAGSEDIAASETIDKHVENIDKSDKKTANADGGKVMKLAQFLAENPDAQRDYDAECKKNYDSGFEAANERNKRLMPYIGPDSKYPDELKVLAFEVLEGKCSFDAVRAAACVLDAQAEKKKSVAATEESAELPDTTAIYKKRSTDGELRTEADAIDAMNKILALEGRELING